jgi:hypothetical protein
MVADCPILHTPTEVQQTAIFESVVVKFMNGDEDGIQ